MTSTLHLGDIEIEVIFKDIRNVHLAVYPPAGRVRIAAPRHMKLDTVRVFALSKLSWIRKQQAKLRAQERETPREYVNRESHYVWGRRYLMKLVEKNEPARVELLPRTLRLHVRPGTSLEQRKNLLEAWYRQQLHMAATTLMATWQPRLGVKVTRLYVQQMKTRWGSCNPDRGTVRLNTELAKKPPECMEYILVHELVHLLEPSHNARFLALMDRFMPNWRMLKDCLNQLPVRHEEWDY